MVGPTASGKTSVSIDLAKRIDAEIVSVDSAQIYRGMDIGTEKARPDELVSVPHHMIDEADPAESVSVAQFQRRARDAIADVLARNKVPLLVGGSGLYFRAVVDPLEFPGTDSSVRKRLEQEAAEVGADAMFSRLVEIDPQAAAVMDPRNVRRTVRALEVAEISGRKFSDFRTGWDSYQSIYDLKVAGLTLPLEELDRRIDDRVDEQMRRGLLDEVRQLADRGMTQSLTSVQALGYAQILAHLQGLKSLEDAVAEIKGKTRRFARRQLTWFRADPRIRWFEGDPSGAAAYLEGELHGY